MLWQLVENQYLHGFADYVVLAYFYKSKITANSFQMDGSVEF